MSVLAQAGGTVPAWTLFRSREEFGGADLPLLTITSAGGVGIRDLTGGRAPSEDLSGYRVVRSGDLVVNKLWARFGAYGVSKHDGVISPAYWVLRIDPSVADAWFVHYMLRSAPYLAEIGRVSRNLPPNGFDLSWEQFRRLPLRLPPLDEQRRVAGFLDERCALMDRAAEAHKRLLQLQQERVDAKIGRFIEAAFRAEQPHEMQPLKRLLVKVSRPARPDAPVVTAYRDGQVIARNLRRAEGYTETWTDSGTMQGVAVGDVVIHGLDGFAGAIGASESAGNCSPANHVCQPVTGDPDFYGRLLRILAISGYLSLYGGSARERAVDFRNWAKFSAIPVPVVPSDDQFGIGQTSRSLRTLQPRVTALCELLAERKQSLITAATAGQFDVTTARRVA